MNSHIIHANLNNIRKYTVKEDLAPHNKPLSRVKLSLPQMPHLMRTSSSKKKIGRHTKRSQRTNSNESATLPNIPTIAMTRPLDESLSPRQDILYRSNVGKPQLSPTVPKGPVIPILRRSNETPSVRSSIKIRDVGNLHTEVRFAIMSVMVCFRLTWVRSKWEPQ